MAQSKKTIQEQNPSLQNDNLKKVISLLTYIQMGGKINKIDLRKDRVFYTKHDSKISPAIELEDRGDVNSVGDKLIYATFANSIENKILIPPYFLEIEIDFSLPEKYTN